MTEQHDVKTMADGAAVVVGLGGFMGWMTPVVTLIGGITSSTRYIHPERYSHLTSRKDVL
jgi:hypothetical protein